MATVTAVLDARLDWLTTGPAVSRSCKINVTQVGGWNVSWITWYLNSS